MKWYNYLFVYLAGIFLANALPHFVHGVSGEPFTTPFAEHPGLTQSSPLINMLWAGFNIMIGYLLISTGKIKSNNRWAMFVLFAGVMTTGIALSIQIGK